MLPGLLAKVTVGIISQDVRVVAADLNEGMLEGAKGKFHSSENIESQQMRKIPAQRRGLIWIPV